MKRKPNQTCRTHSGNVFHRVFGTICRFHTQVLVGQGDPSLQSLLEARLCPLPPDHGGLSRGHQERLAADKVGLLRRLLLGHKKDTLCLVTQDSDENKQNLKQ